MSHCKIKILCLTFKFGVKNCIKLSKIIKALTFTSIQIRFKQNKFIFANFVTIN